MPPPTALISDHNFKLSVPGLAIGTFKVCHGLSMEFEVFEWAEGGNNEFIHHLPGRLRYPYLRLESGLTRTTPCRSGSGRPARRRSSRRSPSSSRARTRRSPLVDVRRRLPDQVERARRIAAASAAMSEEVIEIAHSGLKMS